MAGKDKHLLQEQDVGSGEQGPGQQDVQRDVDAVKSAQAGGVQDGRRLQDVIEEQEYAEHQYPHPYSQGTAQSGDDPPSHVLQSGSHCARVTTHPMPDGTYEAQVYVRLTREPGIAETYIPAGIYPTEEDAWAAAEQRARRALDRHEF